MTQTDSPGTRVDYRRANLIRKQEALAESRRDIIAMAPEKALDAILGAKTPATLVQSFPEQDFHFMMHRIGVDDFLPVLAMASSQQWEYILDVEVWQGDRFDPVGIANNLNALFKADPKRLMRWLVSEKTEFLETWLFRNMELRIREHDEDPSSFPDGFQTLDDVFYYRFPDLPEESPDADDESFAALKTVKQTTEELISEMINTVADMDLSVMHGILLETAGIIPSEAEEEEFRLRNVRLSEKGFLPFHEAVGIYQPMKPGEVRTRPEFYRSESPLGTDLPLPPMVPDGMIRGDSLFARALSLIDNEVLLINLRSEFASLINRLASTEKKTIRFKEELDTIVQRGCGYLSLGMEVIHGHARACRPEDGSDILGRIILEDIFRVASGVTLEMKKQAREWHAESWIEENRLPLGFLGEEWLGVIGGLLLDRPLFFDNYETGVMYRPFASLADIRTTSKHLVSIMAIDQVLRLLDPDTTSFSHGMLTYKSLVLTLWARDYLGLSSSLEPIELSVFKKFFKALFSSEGSGSRIRDDRRDDIRSWLMKQGVDRVIIKRGVARVLDQLFDELESELGDVTPDDIDSRYIAHLFLTR